MPSPAPVTPAAPVTPNGVQPGSVVKPTTPAPKLPPTMQAAPAEPTQDLAAIQAELKKLETARQDILRKEQKYVAEKRKFGETQKQHNERLSKADAYEKSMAQAKLNPSEWVKAGLGDDWYTILTEAKINGVPPAAIIASEIQKVREDVTKQFETKETERQAAAEASAKKQAEAARHGFRLEAEDFYKTNMAEYPALKLLGNEQAVANTLTQRIEAEYERTKRVENGQLIAPGKMLSMSEAANLVVADLKALAKGIVSESKYTEEFRGLVAPAPKLPAVGGPKLQRNESQQRRTLSNDMTATTPTRVPPAVTAEDRRARALAAFNAVHNKAQ